MNKKWVIKLILILLLLLSICLILCSKLYYNDNTIKNIYINEEDRIVIELYDDEETYCSFNNKDWVNSKNNQCILDYSENNKSIFLKNKYKHIIKIESRYNLSSIKKFEIRNNKIYLAVGGKEKINYYLDSIIKKNDNIVFKSLDNSIATVDKYGLITGKNVGKTTILISLENYNIEVNVVVSDTIVVPNKDYDYKKEYIKCNEFSKDENDLIDEILASRIARVGKSTRAAVVESARFMTLEFSKRIPYFAENGRLSMNGIQAEGRYYKEGMFLSSSRYSDITKSMHGPASWGCKMYSYPVERTIPNGLDCSGFVSWAFINAGFDVGDIGAGITPVKDFTDLGVKRNIKESINSNKIIVGDLLSGKFYDGGHIAILVGIKEDYYYVAESLYIDNYKYYGPLTRKYKSNELQNYFSWHIDMSEFYEEDGNLTNYWIN